MEKHGNNLKQDEFVKNKCHCKGHFLKESDLDIPP